MSSNKMEEFGSKTMRTLEKAERTWRILGFVFNLIIFVVLVAFLIYVIIELHHLKSLLSVIQQDVTSVIDSVKHVF